MRTGVRMVEAGMPLAQRWFAQANTWGSNRYDGEKG